MSSYLEWKKRAIIMGSGGWWLPPNFDPADCLAAYQFKGAGSEAASLSDLTGHGYTLTKTDPQNLMDFDTNEGWIFARNAWKGARALDNDSIDKSINGIKSFVMRFKKIILYNNTYGYHLWYDTSDDPTGGVGGGFSSFEWSDYNGWHVGSRHHYMKKYEDRWPYEWSGVVQFNIGIYDWRTVDIPAEIYVDGKRIPDSELSKVSDVYEPNKTLFGHLSAAGNLSTGTMIAGAFYRRHLTEAEMSYIYDQIAAI